MGSKASVHHDSTFLTATHILEDESEEHQEESGSERIPESVVTVDYEPPFNEFYVESTFPTFKRRHKYLRKKYKKYLAEYVKEQIPGTIQQAKVISSKNLAKSCDEGRNSLFVADPTVLSDMVSVSRSAKCFLKTPAALL